MAHARVRVELGPDWRLRGKARITYDWIRPPGIDFLGRRITFTDAADAKLKPVVRDVERGVTREIAKTRTEQHAAADLRQSVPTPELHHPNTPVLIPIPPQRLPHARHPQHRHPLPHHPPN